MSKLRNLKKEISHYEHSNTKSSVMQMLNTFIPFFVLWFLAYKSLSISYFLTLAICIVAAGFLVRIFIIFHDCCHGSFFKKRKSNMILGTIAGILTFCPFEQWKQIGRASCRDMIYNSSKKVILANRCDNGNVVVGIL